MREVTFTVHDESVTFPNGVYCKH